MALDLSDLAKNPANSLVVSITIVYCLMAIACLTSATFLGCALKNLSKIIKKSDTFEVALKTMNLHIFMMVFHAFFFMMEIVSLCMTFIKPSKISVLLINANRILLFITQSISQLIVMYLIWKLHSKDGSPIIVKRESESDDGDANPMPIPQSDMNMIHFMKGRKLTMRRSNEHSEGDYGRQRTLTVSTDSDNGSIDSELYDRMEHKKGHNS